MRSIFTFLAILLVSSCTSPSGTPADTSTARAAVEAALRVIELGFEREDSVLASQSVDPEFFLGGNVSLRYSDTAWTGPGIGPFRSFFSGSFTSRANIEQDFVLQELEVVGNVAQAAVDTRYTALRLDRTPPENLVAESEDIMVFQRSAGAWRLVRWDTAAPPVEPPPSE